MKQKIILLLLAAILTVSWANSGRRNPSLSDFPAGTKFIAITFDDGPNTTWTPQVLDKLKTHGATATFYVQGQKINETTKPVLERTIREGHDVDSHSWDHPSFGIEVDPGNVPVIRDVATARDNLQRTSQAIFDATGFWPWSFRAPFLEWEAKLYGGIDVLDGIDREFKMAFIDTGLDPRDYANQNAPSTIANWVLNQSDALLDGGIILLHDCGGADRSGTVASLDILLPGLKNKGFAVVSVRELFILKGVTPEFFVSAMWPRVNQRVEKPSLTWRRWEFYDKIVNGGEPESIGRLYPNNMNNWWLQDWWVCPTPPWERKGNDCGEILIPCDVCGNYDCQTEHIKCDICDEYDCQKEHIQCEKCENYDDECICEENPTSIKLANKKNASFAFAGIQSGQINLQLKAGNYTAELFNLQGRLIGRIEINAINGINATGLRTDKLSKGMFILNVKQAETSVLRHKIFVK